MIAHLVLLQPRPDLTEEQRRAALDTLARAATAAALAYDYDMTDIVSPV